MGLHARLGDLLAAHEVTGAALAVVREGVPELAWAGVRDAATGARVDEHTVFQVASLSKPVFSHAVLKLVGEGVLPLDRPLAEIVAPIVPDDPRARRITARHVLTHGSGVDDVHHGARLRPVPRRRAGGHGPVIRPGEAVARTGRVRAEAAHRGGLRLMDAAAGLAARGEHDAVRWLREGVTE